MHIVTHRNFVENVDKRAELCTIFFSHINSDKRAFVLAAEKGLTGGAVIYYNGGAAQKGAHAVRLLRLAVLFLFAVFSVRAD